MTPNQPTPATAPVRRRRRLWPWIVGLCLGPWVIVGCMALNYLTLDRDAAALRRSVMSATHAPWRTTFQVSVGGPTLGVIRAGLKCIENPDVAKARLALGAISRVSVGVYRREAGVAGASMEKLIVETDRTMQQRGWIRLVGVSGKGETVLIHVPSDQGEDRPVRLCLAVVKQRELIVVSAQVDADVLSELARQHLTDEIRQKLQRQWRTAAR